jgi:hypothetical protein
MYSLPVIGLYRCYRCCIGVIGARGAVALEKRTAACLRRACLSWWRRRATAGAGRGRPPRELAYITVDSAFFGPLRYTHPTLPSSLCWYVWAKGGRGVESRGDESAAIRSQ